MTNKDSMLKSRYITLLTKVLVKDMSFLAVKYDERNQVWMKEIKDDINRWRYISCFWVGRINIVKITMLQIAIHRFIATPMKLPIIFFHGRTKNFMIHMKTWKTLNSQSSLDQEKWSWGNQPFWLQIMLQSYSHQESMALIQKQEYKLMQQDRRPRNKPSIYG